MATTADIRDAAFREALDEADRLIGDGDYTAAARLCAETYLRLLAKRPDFIPPPPDPGILPQYREDLPPNRTRLGGGTGAAPRPGWPNQGAIRMLYFEPGGPVISYEKQRFGLSEATSYFEFLMEEVLRSQRK